MARLTDTEGWLTGCLMVCATACSETGVTLSGAELEDPPACEPTYPANLCSQAFPRSIMAADMDGDGVDDLVSVGVGESFTIFAGLQQKYPRVKQLAVGYDYSNHLSQLLACDLDSNGSVDLLSSGDMMMAAMVWLQNPEFDFVPRNVSAEYMVSMDLRCIDFDGDGFLDVMGYSPTGGIRLRKGIGNGDFGPILEVPHDFELPKLATLEFFEYTGDTQIDMVVRASGSPELFLARGEAGGFAALGTVPHSLDTITTLFSGDLDHDSQIDLVLAGTRECGVDCMEPLLVVLSGTGSPSSPFSETSELEASSAINAGVLVELNDDMVLDLVVGDFPTDTVEIFLSDASVAGGWAASALQVDAPAASVAVADFDADRAFDIALAHPGMAFVAVYPLAQGVP